MDSTTLLLLVAPLALLDLGMKVFALVSLHRAERVRGGSKALWVAIILLVNLFGWVAWLLAGRVDGPAGGDR